MEQITKWWLALSGKKTSIAAALLVIAAFLSQVVIGQWQAEADWLPKVISTLEWVGMVLGTGGLTHKGFKLIKGTPENQQS